MARGIQLGSLTGDPIRHVFAAMSSHLDANYQIGQAFRATVADAVKEVREAAGSGARGLTPKGEDELVQRLRERTAYEAQQAVTRIGRTMRAGVVVTAVAVGGVLASAGFIAGRWTADERVIGMRDAAFMAQLAEVNGARNLREFCQANPGQVDGDWQTCKLPALWVHRATGLAPVKKTAGGG